MSRSPLLVVVLLIPILSACSSTSPAQPASQRSSSSAPDGTTPAAKTESTTESPAPINDADRNPSFTNERVKWLDDENLEFNVEVGLPNGLRNIYLNIEAEALGGIRTIKLLASSSSYSSPSIEGRLLYDGPLLDPAQGGGVIKYYWSVVDRDRAEYNGSVHEYFVEDPRYEWEAVSSGGVTLKAFGATTAQLDALLPVLLKHKEEAESFLGTRLNDGIVAYLYPSPDDVGPMASGAGGNYQGKTARCWRESNFASCLRHEVLHAVVDAAVGGGACKVPSWMNEGLAVYFENPTWLIGYSVPSSLQGSTDDVLLGTPYDRGRRSYLFYFESYALISHLIESRGIEEIRSLISLLAETQCDLWTPTESRDGAFRAAFETVYGVTPSQFRDEWRIEVGLPPVE